MFCRNLKEARKKNRYTQQQLADRLYVSKNAIVQWESGTRKPDIDKLKNISETLGVSCDELLDCGKPDAVGVQIEKSAPPPEKPEKSAQSKTVITGNVSEEELQRVVQKILLQMLNPQGKQE